MDTTDTLKLIAEEREETGSRHSRRLRRSGQIPCSLYGTTVTPKSVAVNRHELEMIVKHSGGQNVIFDMVIGDQLTKDILLKELQRDPVTDHAVHADFLKINMTQKLRIMVAVRLVGEPVGVSQHGGILEHPTRAVEVECLPMDIVKEIVLDTTGLNVEERLFVRDIPENPKLTILTPADIVIASVHTPKLEEDTAKPEGEAAESITAEDETKEAGGSAESGSASDRESDKKQTKKN